MLVLGGVEVVETNGMPDPKIISTTPSILKKKIADFFGCRFGL